MCLKGHLIVSDVYAVESLSTLFDTDVQFDFVVNCAGETKLGQSDAVSCVVNCNFAAQFLTHSDEHFLQFSLLGFVTLGFFSVCMDLFVFVCMYFMFCFILHM